MYENFPGQSSEITSVPNKKELVENRALANQVTAIL